MTGIGRCSVTSDFVVTPMKNFFAPTPSAFLRAASKSCVPEDQADNTVHKGSYLPLPGLHLPCRRTLHSLVQ